MKKDLNTTVQGHLGDSVKRSTLDFGPGLDHRVVSLSLTLGSMPFKKKKPKNTTEQIIKTIMPLG